jgi:hypothetical protein
MSMHQGIGYSMSNTVIECEDNERWPGRPPSRVPGPVHRGPDLALRARAGGGGTLVRESWDISEDHQRRMLKLGGLPKKTEANMAKTLDRIAELTETPA